MTAVPPSSGSFLVCVVGPDRGKRLALSGVDMFIGKDAYSSVHSDDPYVTERSVAMRFDGIHLFIWGLAEPLPFINGQSVAQATMLASQQIRIGSSIWEFQGPATDHSVMGFVHKLGDGLSNVAGIETTGNWDAKEIFGDVAKKHSDEDIENFFTVGTASTALPLDAIGTQWPKPWVFARVFGFTAAVYALFVIGWRVSENTNLLPGLLVMGTIAVPLSLLIFFFEVNVPRNVSLYQIIKLLLLGGLVSILVSLIFFNLTNITGLLGDAGAGIVEETGKVLVLLLVIGRPRYRWTLNGLLFGATVGTGFAIFESAGYALRLGIIEDGGIKAMRSVIMLRAVLSIFGGHVLWTGLAGAALWRVRGDQPFDLKMFTDFRFLRVFALCIAMHMIWNSPWEPKFFIKHILLGVPAWLLIFATIQNGLKQIRIAKAAANPAAAPGQ